MPSYFHDRRYKHPRKLKANKLFRVGGEQGRFGVPQGLASCVFVCNITTLLTGWFTHAQALHTIFVQNEVSLKSFGKNKQIMIFHIFDYMFILVPSHSFHHCHVFCKSENQKEKNKRRIKYLTRKKKDKNCKGLLSENKVFIKKACLIMKNFSN